MSDVRYTALIVEDDPLVRELLRDILRDSGFETLEAADGVEALALLNARAPFDALLTDIRLGAGPDGWAVAQAVREVHPDCPVIYMTAYVAGELRKVPGSLFFSKPYRADVVTAAVRALLDGARTPRAPAALPGDGPDHGR